MFFYNKSIKISNIIEFKYLFYGWIWVVLWMVSCRGTDTFYEPTLQKNVKVFRNPFIKFYYPTSWKQFDCKTIDDVNKIVCVSPKKEIYEAFSYKSSDSIAIRVPKTKKNWEKHAQKEIIDSSFLHSSAYVHIKEVKQKPDQLEEYVSSTVRFYEKNKNLEIDVQKIAPDFHIVNIRNQARNRDNNFRFIPYLQKIYIRSTPQKIVELIYIANEYSYSDYEKEADILFRSFELFPK